MRESVKERIAAKQRQRRRDRRRDRAAQYSIEMRIGSHPHQEITFGDVRVVAPTPSAETVRRNLEASSAALRGLVEALTNPGRTRLGRTKDVPFFHSDPEKPGRLIRKLNGKTDRGFIRNGVFEVAD